MVRLADQDRIQIHDTVLSYLEAYPHRDRYDYDDEPEATLTRLDTPGQETAGLDISQHGESVSQHAAQEESQRRQYPAPAPEFGVAPPAPAEAVSA